MLFAALDYLKYRNKTGRYNRRTGTDIMCSSFEGYIPDKIIRALEPGDPILQGNFDWWCSWLIMYLTSSQVSHISIYAGNGKVFHQTLGGPEFEQIENIFSPSVRLLPIKLPQIGDKPKSPLTEKDFESYFGMPYPLGLVIFKAMNILSGRDGRYFRFKFLLDTLIVLAVLFGPMWVISPDIPLSVFCFYFALLLFNGVLAHFYPLPANSKHGKPCDALWQMPQIGGVLLPDSDSPWFKSHVGVISPKMTGSSISAHTDG